MGVLHMQLSPSFLYVNRFGVFCYQRRVPKIVRTLNQAAPLFLRVSLETRSRGVALQRARKIAVMFDELAKQYFSGEKSYALGMKYAEAYIALWRNNAAWEQVQTQLFDKFDIDGSDDALLDKALQLINSRRLSNGHEPLVLSSVTRSHNQGLQESRQAIYEEVQAAVRDLAKDGLTGLTLEEAFERFISSKKVNWKSNGDMELTYRQDTFPVFKAIVGDISTTEISIHDINRLKDGLLKLPANKSKKKAYRSKTILELVAMDIPQEDLFKPATLKKYLGNCSTFLQWMESSQYAVQGIHVPLQRVVKSSGRKSEDRNEF